VAESLGALREAVDEIVVAADARVEATDLAYYADVADVLVRYECAGANPPLAVAGQSRARRLGLATGR
jgi:hypothetical protein